MRTSASKGVAAAIALLGLNACNSVFYSPADLATGREARALLCRQVFDANAVPYKGVITFDQWVDFRWRQTLNRLDTNGDGVISRDEYLGSVKHAGGLRLDSRFEASMLRNLNKVFDSWDSNHDGMIDRTDETKSVKDFQGGYYGSRRLSTMAQCARYWPPSPELI